MVKVHLARFLAGSACAAALILAAGAGRAETLQDALAEAYDHNPGMQAQRAALRALDESYVQARSGFGIQASLNTGETAEHLDRSGEGPPFGLGGIYNASTESTGLTVTDTLYAGGRLETRLDAAMADILAGREQIRRSEIDLMLRVITAYASVRRDMQLLAVNADTVAVLRDQLSDTQARFDVRQVTATDLAQAQARLAQGQTQLVSAQAGLAVSRSQYLEVVGRNPDDLAPEPPLALLPATIEQAFDQAEAHSPLLATAKFQEQSSRAHVAEARAQRMPTVSLRLDARRGPYAPYQEQPYDRTFSASAVVTQPLFTSGQLSSQIRQTIEQNNRDRFNIEDARRTVIQSVSQAWEQLAGSRAALATQDNEVAANEKAFYGVREEEKVGLRSTLEVLNAGAELAAAQTSLLRGRFTEYVSRAQLLANMGLLSIDSLGAPTKAYDPAANFNKIKDKGYTPLEIPARVLDSTLKLPTGAPKPVTLDHLRPDQSSELPPAPVEAAKAPPLTSIRAIMAETQIRPDDAPAAAPDAPVRTAPPER